MKIKVSEATKLQLDYLVAKCIGGTNFHYDTIATYWVTLDGKDRALSKGWAQNFAPSTDPAHAYPIIEREGIELHGSILDAGNCGAQFYRPHITFDGRAKHYHRQEGPTPLIAAMRCFVCSKLGHEVEVLDGLMEQ